VCPYRVISNHLVAGLIINPEAVRAKSAGRYRVDPVAEIKGALKRIGAITRATGWSRGDIEGLSNKDGCWEAFDAVFAAEHALEKALAIFRSQTSGLPRGRAGALHVQAAARALATAWRVLTGRLPAKDNEKLMRPCVTRSAVSFSRLAYGPRFSLQYQSSWLTSVRALCLA
jgi:hypothetical protein